MHALYSNNHVVAMIMLVILINFSTVMAGGTTSMIERTSGAGRNSQPNPEPRPKQAATCINRNCDDGASDKKEMKGDAPVEHNCNADALTTFISGRRPRTASKSQAELDKDLDLDYATYCANARP